MTWGVISADARRVLGVLATRVDAPSGGGWPAALEFGRGFVACARERRHAPVPNPPQAALDGWGASAVS